MKKINILLLFFIILSSCSTQEPNKSLVLDKVFNYYGDTIEVDKCNNLICRKHRIHYNENKIFLKKDKFEIKSTFKREHPLDPFEYEANVYFQYTINF